MNAEIVVGLLLSPCTLYFTDGTHDRKSVEDVDDNDRRGNGDGDVDDGEVGIVDSKNISWR